MKKLILIIFIIENFSLLAQFVKIESFNDSVIIKNGIKYRIIKSNMIDVNNQENIFIDTLLFTDHNYISNVYKNNNYYYSKKTYNYKNISKTIIDSTLIYVPFEISDSNLIDKYFISVALSAANLEQFDTTYNKIRITNIDYNNNAYILVISQKDIIFSHITNYISKPTEITKLKINIPEKDFLLLIDKFKKIKYNKNNINNNILIETYFESYSYKLKNKFSVDKHYNEFIDYTFKILKRNMKKEIKKLIF